MLTTGGWSEMLHHETSLPPPGGKEGECRGREKGAPAKKAALTLFAPLHTRKD
jgi:hypothetical protein